MRQVATLLEAHGLQPDPLGLFDFLQAGIELRELSKFHFTRNLSDALALVAAYGSKWDFSLEELAYCDIAAFKELYIAAARPRDVLGRSIEQGKQIQRNAPPFATALDLPPGRCLGLRVACDRAQLYHSKSGNRTCGRV